MLQKKSKKVKPKRESVERPITAKIFNSNSEFRLQILEDLKHFKLSSGKSSFKKAKPQLLTHKKKTFLPQPCSKLRKKSIECGKIKEKVLKKKEKINSIKNAVSRRRSLEMISLSPIKSNKDTSLFETSLARII